MAKLILREQDGTEKSISLEEKGSITIGRAPDCDLPITDTQASRRHCSVVRLQSGYEVADLGSTNGTLLNSTLVKKQKLRHGDVIRIGHTEIVYDDPDAAPAAGAEAQTCSLVYAKGDQKGQKIELTGQRTTIGRKQTNTVVLDDTVCSSYHCEVVRDLNGYTIRDLGSTNGTLVNGEMITESQLIHGARIRIGNTRFVFQDPAMAEIDLELAGVEDDEPEWGMMRELDLAAVRRRHPATIVYTVLFVLIVGALGYLTTIDKKAKDTGPVSPAGNLHEPFSFESQASRFAWRSEPAGAVRMAISTKKKGQGKSALELRSGDDGAEAFYAEVLAGNNLQYRLEAKVAAAGTTARIGLLWSGLGLKRWALSDPVTSGSLQGVNRTFSSPPWATRARLGVQVEGAGTVYLDDVSLVRSGAPDEQRTEQNEFLLVIVDGNYADVSHAGAPILANGRVFARDGAGNPVDAKMRAETTDAEHTRVTIEADGATEAGVEFEEVSGYLSRGGFRAFGQKDAGETYYVAAFPDEGSLPLTGVRKLLLGPSGRAFAALGATPEATLSAAARVEGRRRLWSLRGPVTDGAFAFRFKNNLRGETTEAANRMAAALDKHQTNRWGEFLDEASQALAEFPFARRAMRQRLGDLIAEVQREYVTLANEADRNLADYEEFKDLQSLDNVQAILKVLRTKFQIKDGEGQRGQRLQRVARREAELRAAALKKRQGELAQPLQEQAEYIHEPEGEVYSAAVLYGYVAKYLPDSPQAAAAREKLAALEKQHPEIRKVLMDLGLWRN